MILASCNGGDSSGSGGGVVVTTAPSAPSSLSLVTPGSSPGLDSTPTISVGGVVSGNTVKLFSDSACATTEIGSAVSSGTSVNITTSALALGSYTFYANSANAYGTSSCSVASVSYSYGAVPSAPSSLSLVTPGSSPGLDSTPTISVGGVVSGNTVKLFSDSACATTEIGSAVSSDTSVNITVSSALSVSSHTIYANASNAFGTSPCSSSYVSYEIPVCPPEFVLVPFNSSVGTTSNFCVMKYEAKNNGSGVAVSQAAGNPYVSITIGDSQTKCTDLNALNGVSGKFDLISNPEWMTIARNAEGVGANWEAGTSGSGAMFRGHSDNSAGALSAAADNDPYNGTGNTDSEAMGSGKEQKRTLTLSNGEVIWDLSGNVWEWVDWSHTTAGLQLGPTTCVDAGWTEFSLVSCGDLSSSPYMPFITNLSSTNGVGKFYGGSGGAAVRGGTWSHGAVAGAFTLYLNFGPDLTSPGIGFRCVYRP